MHRYIAPLEVAISERLFAHLANLAPRLRYRDESLLPSISWVRFKKRSSKTAGYRWALHLVSARVLPIQDRFRCESITLHIGTENRDALRGKLIDLVDGRLRVTEPKKNSDT